jgi:ABC-2 type transport system permease protein
MWLIARYEYVRHVRRRAFLWTVFGIPLLVALVLGVVVALALMSPGERRIGVVDASGIVRGTAAGPGSLPVEQFADEAAAQAAFEAGSVDAYVVVPADYLQRGEVRAVGRRALSEDAQRTVEQLLQNNLLATVPQATRSRVADPVNLVLRTLDGAREVGASSGFLFFLPYAFAILFVMTTFTTSGYLIQALTEEKEDRVMEILATTVRAEQMMAGKIIGLSAVGATQMLVWVGVPALVTLALSGGAIIGVADGVPWSLFGLAVAYFFLGFLLIASCYAAVGAAVTSPQEAQAFVAPISLLAVAPLVLVTVILARPNGAVAVVFSLVPFSSAMTMLMRLPLADVPLWQIVVSFVVLALSTVVAVWLSARVMRLGMLRFSQRLRLGEIFGRGAR